MEDEKGGRVGREGYIMRINVVFEQNHDEELSGSEYSLLVQILCRILFWRREIIPNRPSCLWWRRAVAPTDPAINMVKHSGVFLWSFCKFWRVFFRWDWRISSSDFFSIKAATPENKTGLAKIDWILRLAAGFAFWFLARPDGRTANRAFMWQETRFWIWGRFPWMLLITPTCSVLSTNLIGMLSMCIRAFSEPKWKSVQS